jgi:uncharacterized protein DUF4157
VASSKRLTPAEHAALGGLPQAVDCRRVWLHRSDRGLSGLLRRVVLTASRNRAIALGNHVFLPDRFRSDVAVIAHELTHCAQYQSWGPLRYFGRGVVEQARDLLYRTWRIGSSPYHYVIQPGKEFAAYGMEQQGQIVEDSFRGHPTAQAVSPFRPSPGSGGYAVPSA